MLSEVALEQVMHGAPSLACGKGGL